MTAFANRRRSPVYGWGAKLRWHYQMLDQLYPRTGHEPTNPCWGRLAPDGCAPNERDS